MQRYFIQSYTKDDLPLDSQQMHHIRTVMRMKVGDIVEVVLLDETAGKAEIIALDNQHVVLQWYADDNTTKELPIQVTISCGLTKGDKLEWVVQKGTELGASAFVPIETAWSVVKWESKKVSKKVERLQKIAQEAAEQSHRNVIPVVSPLQTLSELVGNFSQYDVVLVAYEEEAKQGEVATFKKVLQQLQPKANVLCIFGSEGGLSPKEIELFVANGAKLCGLGPRILRAETAPLYMLSAISFALELNEGE